jgi:hypothetical protein
MARRDSRSIHLLSEPAENEAEQKSVLELVEQAGREAAVLTALRNKAALRRNAPTTFLGVLAVLAGLTAFALANWAAVDGLSTTWPGWLAALVLAVAWLVVAAVAGLIFYRRSSMTLTEEEAEARLQATLAQLADAVAGLAQEQIAAAIMPFAGGMVKAGEGMIDATDDVLEAADEITDAIEERLPGGIVINRAVDIALVPGRFGVRVARSVLKIGGDEPAEPNSG